MSTAWLSRGLSFVAAVAGLLAGSAAASAASSCVPGWPGTVLLAGQPLAAWGVESDAGSSGTVSLVPGPSGQAVRLDWAIGTGDWVQARYRFPGPVDLSEADLFGVTLRGDAAAQEANTVGIMFADVNDVFFGHDLRGVDSGVNQVGRWMNNLPFPRKLLTFFFGPSTSIDWTRIDRFFLVVKRPGPGAGGGSGQLTLETVRSDRAALWPRPSAFSTPVGPASAARRAIGYLQNQQASTGLFVSWKEEEVENPPPKAWLYDQALALLALTREGRWRGQQPDNAAARSAARLVAFVSKAQKPDGHWARVWNPRTGAELADDRWVGDQAWMVIALAQYASRAGSANAAAAAERGTAWLAARIKPSGGVVGSTEGTVDTFWAMVATRRTADAVRVRDYLLRADTVWDVDLRYWWRGSGDPGVAMDVAAWLSAFARHPLVNRPGRGLDALRFVRRTLVTNARDLDRWLCGFDGQGPVGIWYEGTAQYVAAGGEDAQSFLDMLLSRQRADGSMPGSPERSGGRWRWNRATDAFGWLSRWSGIAPTAWLYFALTGQPFPR